MYKISWNEFESLALDLSKQILNSKNKYNFIIGVSRGGLLLARVLSSALDLPMGVITSKHISGKHYVDARISSVFDVEGCVLLVDDVSDFAVNNMSEKILKTNPKISSLSLACLFFKKEGCNFLPSYYIKEVENILTIVFPYQEVAIKKNLKYF